MKNTLVAIFAFLPFSFSFSFGQTTKSYEHIEKYPNGNIKEKGYWIPNADIEKLDPMTTHCIQYKNIGYWEYWYENGNKKLEIIYGEKTRYINMWYSDGTQILKNGNGYYPCFPDNPLSDPKMVYVIKDSIKTNQFVVLNNLPSIK